MPRAWRRRARSNPTAAVRDYLTEANSTPLRDTLEKEALGKQPVFEATTAGGVCVVCRSEIALGDWGHTLHPCCCVVHGACFEVIQHGQRACPKHLAPLAAPTADSKRAARAGRRAASAPVKEAEDAGAWPAPRADAGGGCPWGVPEGVPVILQGLNATHLNGPAQATGQTQGTASAPRLVVLPASIQDVATGKWINPPPVAVPAGNVLVPASVTLKDLKTKAELNRQQGEVEGWDAGAGRYVVRVGGTVVVKVRPENVLLPPGVSVRRPSSQAPCLRYEVVSYDSTEGVYELLPVVGVGVVRASPGEILL
mmetsp:Transcript_88381/g.202120  ORF Transcript_88381/g.202120 Transcript_88381/m.202120 type:complete len:311 (-) Transcript_88381:30-962(-)